MRATSILLTLVAAFSGANAFVSPSSRVVGSRSVGSIDGLPTSSCLREYFFVYVYRHMMATAPITYAHISCVMSLSIMFVLHRNVRL